MRRAALDRTPDWVNRVPKAGLYVLGFVPAVWFFYLGFSNQLGGNPVKELEHALGLWSLRFIVAGLAITPLRRQAGVNLLRFRRAVGLLAFYYALLHFGVYLVFDQGLVFERIVKDIVRRPYIIAGMVAFILMIPLAATSNRISIRTLGGKAWARLHRLVYLSAIAAAVHFLLVVKSWPPEPLVYAALIAALLCYRLIEPVKQRLA